MKIKNKIGIVFLLAISLFVLPCVMAITEVHLNSPTLNTNHTGTALFNASFTNDSVGVSIPDGVVEDVNISFYYNSSATDGWTLIGWATTCGTNETDAGLLNNTIFCWATLDISDIPEGRYIVNATVWNATEANINGTQVATEGQMVTLDSTKPTMNLKLDLSGSEHQSYGRGVEYFCGTYDGTDDGSSKYDLERNVTITHPTGDATSVTVLSATEEKQQFLDTDYPGDYVFTCSALDYTGNSASSTSTVTIDDLGRIQISGGLGSSNKNMLVIIAIIGIIAYFVFNRKK